MLGIQLIKRVMVELCRSVVSEDVILDILL